MGVTLRPSGTVAQFVWDDDAADEFSRIVNRMIVKRTFETRRDIDDRPYQPYSPDYREELRAAGESVRVDLYRSGELRAGIEQAVAYVDEDQIRLSIPDAVLAKATKVTTLRQFWGLSPRNKGVLQDEVIGRVVRRAMERSAQAPESLAATGDEE